MVKIQLRFAAALLPFILLGCQSNLVSRSGPLPYDNAAYQVYSDLFLAKDTVGVEPGHPVVIQCETVSGLGFVPNKDISKCFPSDWEFRWEYESTIADYYKQNRVAHELSRQFSITSPYELVPEAELISLESHGNFPRDPFLEKIPDSQGYVAVSAVGFNSRKTRAIVSAMNQCGFLCGGGRIYALERENGKWVQVHAGCTWTE